MIGNITSTSIGDIEELIYKATPAIILLIVLVVLRYFINRLMLTLYRKGYIGIGTKITIMRIMDSIFILVFALFIIQSYIPSIVTYAVIIIFAVLVTILFFYEIREFTAYISLQLLKYIRARYLEIKLPGHAKPIYGRIVSMDPFSSTIEDVFGNKTYIANSLLLSAAISEVSPFIHLRIRVRREAEKPLHNVLHEVLNVFKQSGVAVFRVNEEQVKLEKISANEIVLCLRLIPVTSPIRISDVVKLIRHIEDKLKDYNVVIELL